MYLQLDEHNKVLHWFNEEKGKFLVAVGADGAPFGKDETDRYSSQGLFPNMLLHCMNHSQSHFINLVDFS